MCVQIPSASNVYFLICSYAVDVSMFVKSIELKCIFPCNILKIYVKQLLKSIDLLLTYTTAYKYSKIKKGLEWCETISFKVFSLFTKILII